MWTSLLVVCVPGALAIIAWVLLAGGRPAAAELAGAYLAIVIAGRAQALERERREKPARMERVRTQIDLVKLHMPLGVMAVEPVRKRPPVEPAPPTAAELEQAEAEARGIPMYTPPAGLRFVTTSAEASVEAA